MKRDEAVLMDIVEAARQIRTFVRRETRSSFHEDTLVQSAVLHQLLVLGEAAKRLSDAFRMQHPAVPWSRMARMRDRLIHGYDTIDLDIVWNTAQERIPALLEQVEPLLSEQDE